MTTPTQSYPATLTAKMQLTLPKRLCERLGIKRGDKLAVTVEDGSIILTPMRSVIDEVAGSLHMDGSTDTNISRKDSTPRAALAR